MRLPANVTADHVKRALEAIDSGRIIVPKKRGATKYALRYAGHDYPPKFVICAAHTFIDHSYWPNIFAGGNEANNFLIARGFEIWDKISGERVGVAAEDELEESRFPEGAASYRTHRKLERDSKIAKAAKNKRLREVGELICDVCGFSFSRKYGNIGVGYIEAHHTTPVSQLKGRRNTKIEEFALVRSNCHRMLHRTAPWLSIEALKRCLATA